jgi:glutamate 5-kinase
VASLTDAKRLVVKIGSALLVDRDTGKLRAAWLASLAADVAWLRAQGTQVVVVSSGSIALGRGVLGLTRPDLALEQSQAAAAVGQIRLAQAYEMAMSPHEIVTAQVLVTLEDSRNRKRYLNSRATLEQLLTLGVLPIVNENDTVATDEIRFGDNDRLAAQIAATIGADSLVLLSDVDGFYSGNPNDNPNVRHFETVAEITPELEAMAGDAGSGLSKGGMKTKLMAAKTATAAGAAMAICNGRVLNPLRSLHDGARSTWFTATLDPQAARKRWIGAMKPEGVLRLDAGATEALSRGKSLLPAGVTDVSGSFDRGAPVILENPNCQTIAVGLSRYTSDEARQIKGHHSSEIEDLLGYPGRAALVHRDDLAL